VPQISGLFISSKNQVWIGETIQKIARENFLGGEAAFKMTEKNCRDGGAVFKLGGEFSGLNKN
jgi:hypothetical protein